MDELRKAFLGKTSEMVLACRWFSLGLSSLDGVTRAGTQGHKGIRVTSLVLRGFPGSSAGKESTCNEGDPGSTPGLGSSLGEEISTPVFLGFPSGSDGKQSACNVGDLGLIPGLGRSPGEGKGYPLQYSGLENPMDCVVHGVTKSWTD